MATSALPPPRVAPTPAMTHRSDPPASTSKFDGYIQAAQRATEQAALVAKERPPFGPFANVPRGIKGPFPPIELTGTFMGDLLSAPVADGEFYPHVVCITELRARPGKRGWLIQGEGMAYNQGKFSLDGLAADDGKAYWVQKQKANGLSFRVIEGEFDLKKRTFVGSFHDRDGLRGIVIMNHRK